jgi:hypothetical protein
VKDKVIEWLDPKPATYLNVNEGTPANLDYFFNVQSAPTQ